MRQSEKVVKDFQMVFPRDADARIRHRHPNRVRAPVNLQPPLPRHRGVVRAATLLLVQLRREPNRSPTRRVFQRVIQEVRNNLMDLGTVKGDWL